MLFYFVSACLCLTLLARKVLPLADRDVTCERAGQHGGPRTTGPSSLQRRSQMKMAPMELREQSSKSDKEVRLPVHVDLTVERQNMKEELSTVFDPDFNSTSLTWALVIDGKDADKGENAYGDRFHWGVLEKVLPWVLQRPRGVACERVSVDLVEHAHELCCPDEKLRDFHYMPMLDYGPSCFKKMGCNATQAAIEDIPPELMEVHDPSYSSDGRCEQVVKVRTFNNAEAVKQELDGIVSAYNDTLASINADDDNAKLGALAQFLRSFAWLHPWLDCNGRTRTLLLQHQLRCLGLAPGAFMYNNNRDIFFIDKATYMEKIREGIRMAGVAVEEPWGENLWLDHDRVQENLQRFPTPGNGKCFFVPLRLGKRGVALHDQ